MVSLYVLDTIGESAKLKDMSKFKVTFHYKREVSIFVEAEDEADIDGFFTENPTFDVLEDYPHLVESDESSFDQESEEGDYEITETNVTPSCVITPGFELEELE